MDSLDTKIDKYFEKYNVNNRDPISPEYFSGAVKIALNEYDLPIPLIANKFQALHQQSHDGQAGQLFHTLSFVNVF